MSFFAGNVESNVVLKSCRSANWTVQPGVVLVVVSVLSLIVPEVVLSQVPIGSPDEDRLNTLSLLGAEDRPYLNYRTLSDSDWDGEERWRVFGPELYTSYNTTRPYGQNDGSLWQGRGTNARATAGARFAARGLSVTLRPELAFSQNIGYSLLPSAYESDFGYIWGYGFNRGVDAPQRFGDDPFFDFSWGDSELRYSWRAFTAGVGTQTPWVGPSRINSLIHSNNAPPYPKVDIGVRRTPLTIGSRVLGQVEYRLWAGRLSESSFFDSDPSNDNRLITGLSMAFQPSFTPGLTLHLNRTYIALWERESLGSLASLAFFGFNSEGGADEWDQRMAVGFSYLLSQAGFELYGEIGINDNPAGSLDGYIRNFSHTLALTGGVRKAFYPDPRQFTFGEVLFEWSMLEMSPTYSQFFWSNSYYMHHLIVQGYTSEGQWIGAGIGTGGNSQYLGVRLYKERSSFTAFVHRYNTDNDFLLRFTTPSAGYPNDDIYGINFRTVLSLGAAIEGRIASQWRTGFSAVYQQFYNPDYQGGWIRSDIEHGAMISATLRYVM